MKRFSIRKKKRVGGSRLRRKKRGRSTDQKKTKVRGEKGSLANYVEAPLLRGTRGWEKGFVVWLGSIFG